MSEARSVKVQVLVIGSGAGGAVTAVELARAGYEVVVLEEGARHGLESYGQGLPQAMQLLYRNRGMTPIFGSVPIGFVEGRCLGGSTEINSGFWHRLPPEFILRWTKQFEIKDFSVESLEEHFEWTEQQLKVAEPVGQFPKSTTVFKRGVEAMGWSARTVPRAASDCVNTNSCAAGCPKGAKQGVSRNLIPLAEASGAKFVTDCKVKLLLRSGKKVTGVLAEIKREDNSTDLVRIDAEHIFLCAGATQTPALLRRSGIKFHIGDTFQIHPMLKISALFDEEINAQKSVMPLIQVKEFWPDISFGGSFFTVGQLAMNLSDNWPETHDLMENYRNMATYYVAVRGTGRGTVRPARFGSEYAILKYELSQVDLRHISQGLARLSTLLLAAGAKCVYPSVQSLPAIESELEAVRWLDENLPKNGLSLTTVHAFSTCPMGERMERTAADSFGKVWGFDNLFINDASMLPDSPGINPQGTIMALARRNAQNFIENRNGHSKPSKGSSIETVSTGSNKPQSIEFPTSTESRGNVSSNLAIVTGAPGWLGTRLVECLLNGLDEVPGLDHVAPRTVRVAKLPGSDDRRLRELGERVQIIECDITDDASLKKLFADSEGATIFHAAGIIHPNKGCKQFFDVNVKGTQNLVMQATLNKAKRFIHVSSNSPIGCNPTRDKLFDENSPVNPYMNYGKSKLEAENIVKTAGSATTMETVIIRPPWFYGPGQPERQSLFFSMIKNGKGPIVGDGENLRSMAYIDNICQGLMLCERIEEANGRVYWIADRRPYTMNEVIDTIERLLENEFGMKVAHKRMRLPGIASEVALMVDATIQGLGLYHQKFHVLSEMNKNIACSVAKAERELGYDPKISLEEGMRRSIKWALANGQQI